MEEFLKAYCEHWNHPFDKLIQKYNSNIKTNFWYIDHVIDYKIKNNKDVIYKEDIPKILGLSQEKFMEKVMKSAKYYNVDINNLTIKNCCIDYILFYHMSTFLDNETVDIKIALKD